MTEPNPADMIARQIANQVCENWEIAAFTQEWAIARDAAIAALQQSRSAVEALERIKSATANEVRAGDKGYVSRYGIHGIASKALSQESADA